MSSSKPVVLATVFCLVVSPLLTSCLSRELYEQFDTVAKEFELHGHARLPFTDKTTIALFNIWHFLWSGRSDGLSSSAAGPWSSRLASPGIQLSDVRPEARIGWKAAEDNAFFDRNLDGAWMVRSGVFFEGDYGEMPFLLLANAGEGWVYLSVVFQDAPACAMTGRPAWSYFYTNDVTLKQGSGEYRLEHLAAELLAGYSPEAPEVEMSYAAHPLGTGFWGEGSVHMLDSKKALFTTRDDFFRLDRPTKAYGLWSSGLTARVYAGEFLEPPLFNPVNLMLVDVPVGWRGGMYVLLGFQPILDVRVDGDQVSFEYPTANGPVDAELELKNGVLQGRIFDPLSVEYKELTLKRAGSMPKKPKLKRVTPAKPPLAAVGRKVTLQIKGKNLPPGSMVYFDHPDLKITSIKYLKHKKMKVTVEATRPLARGTKVDVMVLTPDNRSAEKSGAFQVG